MAARKVRFYHYVLTIIWPPLVYFVIGRPVMGLLISLVWVIWGFGLLIPTLGANWAIAIFGRINGGILGLLGWEIAAWHRLRLWERGYETLD
ncbi:MAG: hypothetical protein GC131_04515 [Alphaproteobacteria bacterium]|nr:hypothetical protein [Alphaproteobacteria bacterium]